MKGVPAGATGALRTRCSCQRWPAVPVGEQQAFVDAHAQAQSDLDAKNGMLPPDHTAARRRSVVGAEGKCKLPPSPGKWTRELTTYLNEGSPRIQPRRNSVADPSPSRRVVSILSRCEADCPEPQLPPSALILSAGMQVEVLDTYALTSHIRVVGPRIAVQALPESARDALANGGAIIPSAALEKVSASCFRLVDGGNSAPDITRHRLLPGDATSISGSSARHVSRALSSFLATGKSAAAQAAALGTYVLRAYW